MQKKCEKITAKRALRVLEMLPDWLYCESLRICSSRRGGVGELRELALRVGGRCSVKFADATLPLSRGATAEELENTLHTLTEGSVYSYADTMRMGYLPMREGIRVGVCGTARYERGEASGISSVSSLIFRIPGHSCEFAEELFRVWDSGIGTGMLIYSPPGGGKTTALRALAGYIGGGRRPCRVAVVDERMEFCSEDYAGCEVDILSGYHRAQGIEIATRTLCPDVIITDELSGEDAAQIRAALYSGVPIIATAHAKDVYELMAKDSLGELVREGIFRMLVGIRHDESGYSLTVDRVDSGFLQKREKTQHG